MEKAVLHLGAFRAHFHLRLVQTCKYHSNPIKVKKYRLLEHEKAVFDIKNFSTHKQLRKEASQVKTANDAPSGIPYSKLSIGVPKEVWKNERRYIKLKVFF